MATARISAGNAPKRVLDETVSEPAYHDNSDSLEQQNRPKKRARMHISTRGSDEPVDLVDAQTNMIVATSSSESSAAPRARRRRVVGKLAMMMSMPIDVFFEIAHYIGPDDLLRLSRSSKALRDLLMSKASRMIWRAAEKLVGLPECPMDLSSPQYASFIFDTFCTDCQWKSIRGQSLGKIHIMGSFADKRAIHKEYSSIKEYSEAQKTFVNERRIALRQMWPGIRDLSEWMQRKKRERRDHSDARSSREDDIFDNLRELGYTDEEFRTNCDEYGWKWKNLINQPRRLTDRIWKNILPQLEETIRLRREKKALRAKELRIYDRRRNLQGLSHEFVSSDEGRTCCVVYTELVGMSVFQEVVNSDEAGKDISKKDWDLIKQKMLDMSENRTQKLADKAASSLMSTRREFGLPDIFPDSLSEEGPVNNAILQHPTSFIENPRTRTLELPLTFGASIDHLRKHCSYYFTSNPRHAQWELGKVARSTLSIADALYASIGAGVASTLDGMEALGKSFICMRCSSLTRRCLSWIELVQHFWFELEAFKDRDSARQIWEKKGVIEINIQDHDIETPQKLAVLATANRVIRHPDGKEWSVRITAAYLVATIVSGCSFAKSSLKIISKQSELALE
ncbi:hypothetical protein EW145_g6415 [Phellinidium pouzarii]|uniref:F-box domain-containing protein n=1 Tax=Phellinidium pouzarii TaxID=167371 RepID=A0A4S4KYH3_9AGAM|nr:hypothetical protein EW145_g6415 [Phellinidium pouzarii]